jgi:hypothetical protein
LHRNQESPPAAASPLREWRNDVNIVMLASQAYLRMLRQRSIGYNAAQSYGNAGMPRVSARAAGEGGASSCHIQSSPIRMRIE